MWMLPLVGVWVESACALLLTSDFSSSGCHHNLQIGHPSLLCEFVMQIYLTRRTECMAVIFSLLLLYHVCCLGGSPHISSCLPLLGSSSSPSIPVPILSLMLLSSFRKDVYQFMSASCFKANADYIMACCSESALKCNLRSNNARSQIEVRLSTIPQQNHLLNIRIVVWSSENEKQEKNNLCWISFFYFCF